MAEYLHARLIKTAELSPEQSYIFAAYPHGISAIGGWLSFATEATGFSTLFPGVLGGRAQSLRVVWHEAVLAMPSVLTRGMQSGLQEDLGNGDYQKLKCSCVPAAAAARGLWSGLSSPSSNPQTAGWGWASSNLYRSLSLR
jgi:hypothetical protein